MTIKRYRMVRDPWNHAHMTARDDGDYVLYDDHIAALRREREPVACRVKDPKHEGWWIYCPDRQVGGQPLYTTPPDAQAALTAIERAEYERGKAETNALPADFTALVVEAAVEAEKAMRKFPQPNYVISKFAEEAGEVVKAAIHHAENRETREAVVSEMRQVLAMMLRLWIEGDRVHGMKPLALLTQEGR